ncbi:hypothetical protein [Pimelobacter simplex]|uniref:hypothetical protein n=1 Tax=Nocardioides simplex TaxID=2045 RepID=UPI003AAD7E4A
MAEDQERFTALPWAAWAVVTGIVVTSTDNVVVLASAALGCWLALAGLGGPRRDVGRAVLGLSLVLAAAWAVLGVLVHRDGLGGPVVWLLPEWSPETGGHLGGAVTGGQLHLALAGGCRAAAVVAVLGVLAQAVPAARWTALAHAVWGRAGRVWTPMLCLGDAYVAARRDRVAARRSGLDAAAARTTVLDVARRSQALADDARAARTAPPPSSSRALGVLMAALAVTWWWATQAFNPDPWLPMSGAERTAVAAAVVIAAGLLLHRTEVPRPLVGDLLPLLCAVLVATAWFGRDVTGEAGAMSVEPASAPAVPMVLVASLAALPVLVLATRRPR